ncbi:MAG TPA: AraC family transcriptional regulator [Spirochaetia bacterium]|nr:AraC family transcriptional regulator [Spirochaetia bacterium]
MDKQFYFFNMSYEQVPHAPGALFRTFFISIGYAGMHWHKEMEMLLVLDGSISVTSSGQTFTLQAGDLFWVNAWEAHSLLETADDNLLLVLQIDPAAASGASAEFHDRQYELTPARPLPLRHARNVCRAMARLLTLSAEQPTAHALSSMEALYSILASIRQGAAAHHPMSGRRRDGQVAERTKEIVDYLNRRYREPISLKRMSAHFRLSPFYVSHLIRLQTGFSFQEHLSFIRLHHAVDLMMTTDLRLIDIALESGFSDPKYLNKYFRLLFGMRPSELRRKENWKQVIKSRFGQGSLDVATLGSYLAPYLSQVDEGGSASTAVRT